MINVLIIEDNFDVRSSLMNILETDPEIHVIGEASNGLKAVELAKSLLPDIILMDIKLPQLDGLEAAKQIKDFCISREISIKILIFSTFYDDEFVTKSQEYGVDGYLLKGMAFDKLASAIKNTCNGFVTIDPVIYEKKITMATENADYRARLRRLNKSELKVLQLIVKGKNNPEIAAELFFSEGTVRNCISSMLSKLECKNSRDLVVFGVKAGL